jgi:flagellar motor component MotA
VEYAVKACKEGIVALDRELEKVRDPFLKKSLMLAIDGTEPQELRKIMELEMDNQAEHEERLPQVFESAGGYAPTIGIIGAVLGLIQVMQHLDNMSTARATELVRLFTTRYGISANRLSVAGYAEFRPLASNATPEGRSMNRRVDLVVVTLAGERQPLQLQRRSRQGKTSSVFASHRGEVEVAISPDPKRVPFSRGFCMPRALSN